MRIPAAPIVSIRCLSAARGLELSLENVDLDVFPGEIHGLAGPNGAGKTTLLDCLLGRLPFTGTIRLALSPREPIGYVPQGLDLDPALPVSVSDFLALALRRGPAFGRRPAALRAHIASALAETGTEALARRRLAELSGGELRRVLLAHALVPRPKLLVLDEPASHVDEVGTRLLEALLARLAKEGVAILIVEHDLRLLTRLCARVTVLNRRVVSTGDPGRLPPADVLAESTGP
ncbi:MAG TPA: metal ABC transporter ATP-binding protein [Thermoanaerobaculia bacterium]|nr:metal ABC transporter ATP-binding protein [Thermoanaerobaculia bacterium]